MRKSIIELAVEIEEMRKSIKDFNKVIKGLSEEIKNFSGAIKEISRPFKYLDILENILKGMSDEEIDHLSSLVRDSFKKLKSHQEGGR